MSAYPPEPWTLVARMDLSTFLVPVELLPAFAWPAGYRPVSVAGRAPVGAAWVVYGPGGVLAYSELLVSVLVRRGTRVLPHVVAIWVDSPASCAGGRELWGIPKEMAGFGDDPDRPACTPEGFARPVASAEVRSGPVLPARLPLSFSVVQRAPLAPVDRGADPVPPSATDDARPLVSPVRTRARVGPATVRWSIDPDGALGFLAGRRPVASVALREVAMLFGMTPAERSRQAVGTSR